MSVTIDGHDKFITKRLEALYNKKESKSQFFSFDPELGCKIALDDMTPHGKKVLEKAVARVIGSQNIPIKI